MSNISIENIKNKNVYPDPKIEFLIHEILKRSEFRIAYANELYSLDFDYGMGGVQIEHPELLMALVHGLLHVLQENESM